MNYRLVKLYKENDLNRELRKQKKERGELSILFLSHWDKYSKELLSKLERKCDSSRPDAKLLYVVDNYNMPHSFIIFKSSIVPQLVTIKKHRVLSEDSLSMLYRHFELE